MNIGDVSKRTGLPPKTIRDYEDIRLVTPLRYTNGYRNFRDSNMYKRVFPDRARALGVYYRRLSKPLGSLGLSGSSQF